MFIGTKQKKCNIVSLLLSDTYGRLKEALMYLNNLQSFFFGATLLGLVSFVACEKTVETNKIVPFGTKVELGTAESVWFGADTLNGVEISIIAIDDSRCPIGVNCIWAGEARVQFNATQLNSDTASFELRLPTAKKDTLSFKLNQNYYQAVLFGVKPYPSAQQKNAKSRATISLKQLASN
ncbi:hypothetical protein BCY91_09700 [Pelobium manganitolerans]|uniref:Uncharacterized protein n=2 Tax=Pelobium manganitolerans TaxID=1842495 RepID=A0A419S3F7_9SPHI|nr:hypothetical protein BCY91_09700 [Pelobium manganitolerans]